MNALNVDSTLDLKALTREDVVASYIALRTVDPTGFSAYLGKNSTDEQIEAAVIGVRYLKVYANGQKCLGGVGYDVLIDHTKLNHEGDKYAYTEPRFHLTTFKVRKSKVRPGTSFLYGNIFDGKKTPTVARGGQVR